MVLVTGMYCAVVCSSLCNVLICNHCTNNYIDSDRYGYAMYQAGSPRITIHTRSTRSTTVSSVGIHPGQSKSTRMVSESRGSFATFGQYFRSPKSHSDWDNVERYY